jgi:hypothetical protein
MYRFVLHHKQKGQTIVEYLIVLPCLLLLVLGVIQFLFIYQAKTSLNYAAFMGARQGALKNAAMFSIMDGVASGMTPYFMRGAIGGTPNSVDLSKARRIATIEIFNPSSTKIEILNPTPAAMDAFAPLSEMLNEIPNDHLMYRVANGGGMSIQDANLLKIRVTYCVRLVVPFVDRIIYGVTAGIQGVRQLTNESFAGTAETNGNQCTAINQKFGQADPSNMPIIERTLIDGVTQKVYGQAVNPDPTGNFPTNEQLLWNVGGRRIPITAEAVVRMQSPVRPLN